MSKFLKIEKQTQKGVAMFGTVKTIKKFIRDVSGTILIAFAIMAPVIIGSAGMALDYAYAYLVQQRLAQAIDAAALAAAASATDPVAIEQKVRDFFHANYPEEDLGVAFEPVVVINGDFIEVTGYAQYNTFFLSVIGITEIDVEAQTTVQREIQGLEVVMVLDNTGSMATNNNIGALKTGTQNFINTLFSHTDNPNTIKIGIVPYSNTVRVGRYGLGKNPDGTTYSDGDIFVTQPSGVSYTTNHASSSGWYGCVVEHKETDFNVAATHVSGSSGQLWRTGTGTGCNSAANCKGHGWNPASTTNDPYDYDVLDNYTGDWDIYMFGKIISNGQTCSGSDYSSARCSSCGGGGGSCNATYCFCRSGTPNQGCPYAYILPLTSDQATLLDRVDDMIPEGNTLGNIGMAWGARVLSPETPFIEGAAWEDIYWKKAVVMMTDGDNTENGTYSAYWATAKNNMSVTKFNDRFAETCEALKEKGVTIYTVTFTSGINEDTKNYYRNCATDATHYFDAPSQEELIEVFETISRELSNLHIIH
ncbi:MAG: TadE/TadG family type IV pilus assembly protein [Alphaproteobacteria bacterium]